MFKPNTDVPIGHRIQGDKIRTSDVLQGEQISFSTLLLKEEIQKGLALCGYTYLSPIQKTALPLALAGTSIIAHAKSGTGKTLVYVLPVLSQILENPQPGIQCLILSPTREIAKQIYDVIRKVGYFIKDLKAEFFIGGTPVDLDVLKCKDCKIAIGAPGRIRHLIELGEMNIKTVQLFILDEVDALLKNKEFAISELAKVLRPEKQTIVCTATFSEKMNELLNSIAKNVKYVTVNETAMNIQSAAMTSNVLLGIKQYVAAVSASDSSFESIKKRTVLCELLKYMNYDQCFVFVNYVTLAKGLTNLMTTNQINAASLTSEQSQNERLAVINKFKSKQYKVLITTDLSARGIDIHDVNLVINMGIPCPPDVYIHRMGRAGRYGSKGAVVTIVCDGIEKENFIKIVQAVSSDPVDLHVIPPVINNLTFIKEMKVIKCVPEENPSINISEFIFKQQHEMQSKIPSKRKSKKTRNKNRKDEPSPRKSSRISTSTRLDENKCGKMSISPEDSSIEALSYSDKNLHKVVEQYVSSIKNEMGKALVPVDESCLPYFFKENPEVECVEFNDYFNPDYDKLDEKCSENDEIIIDSCVNDGLRKFVDALIARHHTLDELKLPCSTKQFLEMFAYDRDTIRNHISPRVNLIVEEIFEKMNHLVQTPQYLASLNSTEIYQTKFYTQPTKCPTLTSVDSYEEDLMLLNQEKPKNDNFSDSDAEFPTVKRNPKMQPKQIPAQNFAYPQLSLLNNVSNPTKSFGTYNPVYMSQNFPSPRPNSTSMLRLSNPQRPSNFSQNQLEVKNFPHEQQAEQYNIVIPIESEVVEPPSNESTSTSSVAVLPPLNHYVPASTSQSIWRSHFNFIGTHVRSLFYRYRNN